MFSDGGILTFPFWIFFCSRSLGAVNASSRFLVVGTEEGKNAGVLGAPERRVAFCDEQDCFFMRRQLIVPNVILQCRIF
jgi:hypothetical protein